MTLWKVPPRKEKRLSPSKTFPTYFLSLPGIISFLRETHLALQTLSYLRLQWGTGFRIASTIWWSCCEQKQGEQKRIGLLWSTKQQQWAASIFCNLGSLISSSQNKKVKWLHAQWEGLEDDLKKGCWFKQEKPTIRMLSSLLWTQDLIWFRSPALLLGRYI